MPNTDISNVGSIPIYDQCPKHYPVVAQGAYWSKSDNEKGAVNIYLDQCFGHMLTYNNKSRVTSKIADFIFVSLFGKMHLANTLFHEIGHSVYEKKAKNKKIKESEQFAEKYALNLYYQAYPSQKNWYSLTNTIYKLLYPSRIEHDDSKRTKTQKIAQH